MSCGKTRLSVVDWVHSKTQILLATLRTQNQPRGESHVFSEVEHSPPSVGCARNKRQYPTVLQNQKSFRWILDCEWMDYLLLICGKCCVHRRVPNHQPTGQHETARELTNPHPNKRETEMLINCHTWTTSPQTQILLKASLSCTSLKTTKW